MQNLIHLEKGNRLTNMLILLALFLLVYMPILFWGETVAEIFQEIRDGEGTIDCSIYSFENTPEPSKLLKYKDAGYTFSNGYVSNCVEIEEGNQMKQITWNEA